MKMCFFGVSANIFFHADILHSYFPWVVEKWDFKLCVTLKARIKMPKIKGTTRTSTSRRRNIQFSKLCVTLKHELKCLKLKALRLHRDGETYPVNVLVGAKAVNQNSVLRPECIISDRPAEAVKATAR